MSALTPEILRELMGQSLSAEVIGARFGLSRKVVYRLAREAGLSRFKNHKPTPAPADFAENAARQGLGALRERYGRDTSTINRWAAETGVRPIKSTGGRPARSIPDDFPKMAAEMSNLELMAHYACGSEMLYRWRRETGVKRRDRAIIPDDFAEVWKSKGVTALAAHYGRNHSTISTWIKKLGLSRPRGRTLTQQARKAAALPKPQVEFTRTPPPKRFVKPDAFRTTAVDRVQRDMTDAGRAADTLRRDRWTVFRCDEKGRATPEGKMWLCGRVLCTDVELIERAERAARRMAA